MVRATSLRDSNRRKSPQASIAGGLLTIGQAAEASGVSAKMIRHYEAIGVIPRPRRTGGNYRHYQEVDVQILRLVRRARDLGFSIQQIAQLVSLWRNRSRSSASVRRLAIKHIEELEDKIRQLQSIVRTLQDLADHCHGDLRPECPILDEFTSSPSANEPSAKRATQ